MELNSESQTKTFGVFCIVTEPSSAKSESQVANYVLFPEFAGQHPGVAFEQSVEDGLVAEIQSGGNLFHAHIGEEEHILGFHDNQIVDVFHRSLA